MLDFLKSVISGIRAPEDVSTYGHLVDSLFWYTTSLNIFYFTLVCCGIFGFSYFYHHKRHPKAYYTYGNKKKHIMITAFIGLAVFLSIDMNITRIANNDLLGTFWNWPDREKEEVIPVEIMAQQWAWNFRYAGEDGKFNSDSDIVLFNKMVIPVDTKVMIQMVSKDVIHSFYLPNARIKVDAIPGRVTRLWFEITKPGEYDIACAEMCGTHHYQMKAKLIVLSKEEYAVWLEEARRKAINMNDSENLDSYWGWKWES